MFRLDMFSHLQAVIYKQYKAQILKLCINASKNVSSDAKGSAISSHGILGYIPVMATLKFNYSLNERIFFFRSNGGTFLNWR